jgi:hypothetical protein
MGYKQDVTITLAEIVKVPTSWGLQPPIGYHEDTWTRINSLTVFAIKPSVVFDLFE